MSDAEYKDFLDSILQSLQDPIKTTPLNYLINEKVKDSAQDRDLKKKYAHWFVWILIGQLIVMNVIFFLVGLGWLRFESWSLNLYTGGTLAEVFGIVLIITKNLFPAHKP